MDYYYHCHDHFSYQYYYDYVCFLLELFLDYYCARLLQAKEQARVSPRCKQLETSNCKGGVTTPIHYKGLNFEETDVRVASIPEETLSD